MSSLMWAASTGRVSTARYLVEQGADTELRLRGSGFTALHLA
ncbi:unnamed protein product, partial [Discosporangium mesarthrocarpum]